ncbi:MAG: aminotransferase class V-fold PLP-dependent enzyme [bacterium]|nr:aminotransferase class V-fold PLP-dependent enzyme [bacterium]
MNNAATGFPKPHCVSKAVAEYLETPPSDFLRTGGTSPNGSGDILTTCRRKLARLFNAPHFNRIVFTSGSTEALNLALLGMDFQNAHVVTTSIEHNSVYRPLKLLETQGRIQLSIVPCDAGGNVTATDIAEAVRDNTKAVVVNHCSNVCGSIPDLEAIGRIAKQCRAVFIVDASQSAGLLPIDVQAAKVDMLAFSGHKALHGMPGIGGLYIRESIEPNPLKVGGTGIKSDILYQPPEIPVYYEAGTHNMPGIVSLNAGLDFIQHTGFEAIRKKIVQLTASAVDAFRALPGITLYGHPENSSMLSFNIKDVAPGDVGYVLENSFEIIIRSGLHCAPLIHKAMGSFPDGSLRVSPSYFSTETEMECFVDAVKQICLSGMA